MQQRPFRISTHLSSKITELETQKLQLEEHIESMNERLKKHHSLDTSIWANTKEVEWARIKANVLQRKISMLSMNLNDEDEDSIERWKTTTEAKAILGKEVALKKSLQMMTRQSETIVDQAKKQKILPPPNLDATVHQFKKQFRNELIQVMNSQHPNPQNGDFIWCPILGDWCCNKAVASHLFPPKSGDELMKVIFGAAEQDMWIGKPEQGQSERFRACNGILWSEGAEDRFNKGLFTIVPDLDENPTPAQIEAWQRSNPKEYRIRVLRPNAPEMQRATQFDGDVCWKDLDDERLRWRTDFWPRARYLYWSYCEMMLRQAYSLSLNTDASPLRGQEMGKRYWGSKGSYMRKNMLMGFVNEMGHEYEHLMDGAMGADEGEDDDGVEPSQVAVMQTNESILEKLALAERKDSGADMDSEESDGEEGDEVEEVDFP